MPIRFVHSGPQQTRMKRLPATDHQSRRDYPISRPDANSLFRIQLLLPLRSTGRHYITGCEELRFRKGRYTIRGMDLTILVLTLNEASNIRELILKTENVLRDLHLPHEILIVDGGSTDGTAAVAEAASPNVRVTLQDAPGYGSALLKGFQEAQGEYIINLDADLSHDPSFLVDFWKARNESDLIIGSRFIRGGKAEMPFTRKMLSRILNYFFGLGLSLPFRDLSSGFRLYRRSVVRNLDLKGTNFDILQEILVRTQAAGRTIREIPIHYKPRKGGVSHARFIRFGISYLKTFIRAWKWRNSIFAADYEDRAFDSRIPLQRYWQRRRYTIVRNFIEGSRTLDIGCGSSRILGSGAVSVGLDFRINKLRYARKFGIPLVNGNAMSLPFRNGTFDCIVCSEVIGHLPGVSQPLTEIRRVLKPGGILVIGTPDYSKITWRILERMYLGVVSDGPLNRHVTKFTAEILRKEIGKPAFTILRQSYICNSELILKAVLGPNSNSETISSEPDK